MGGNDEPITAEDRTVDSGGNSVAHQRSGSQDEGANTVTTKTPEGEKKPTPTATTPTATGAKATSPKAATPKPTTPTATTPPGAARTPERKSVRGEARASAETPAPASVAPKKTPASSSAAGGATAASAAAAAGQGHKARSTPDEAGSPSVTSSSAKGTAARPPALGPRKVRLSVRHVDVWSVLKFSFLMSFAIGIVIVVGACVFWYLLNGLHVFTTINDTLAEIAGDETTLNILEFVTFERTLSLATMIGLIDVVLLTALSTIFALIYNITASLVGGVTVTLSDE